MDHIVIGCENPGQKQYKKRRDNLDKTVDFGFSCKKRRTCKIIDFAVSGDSRIEENEQEEIEKYQEPKRVVQKIWSVRVKIIPKRFGDRLKETGITAETRQVQKTVLLGTARNGFCNLRLLVVA